MTDNYKSEDYVNVEEMEEAEKEFYSDICYLLDRQNFDNAHIQIIDLKHCFFAKIKGELKNKTIFCLAMTTKNEKINHTTIIYSKALTLDDLASYFLGDIKVLKKYNDTFEAGLIDSTIVYLVDGKLLRDGKSKMTKKDFDNLITFYRGCLCLEKNKENVFN